MNGQAFKGKRGWSRFRSSARDMESAAMKGFTDEREERSYDHNACVKCGSHFDGRDGKGEGFVVDALGRRWNADCAMKTLAQFLRKDEDRKIVIANHAFRYVL